MKFSAILLLIFTKFILEYSYINYVYKYFAYTGFSFEFNMDKYIISWIIYLGGYFLLCKRKKVHLYEIFLILYLIYILPNIIFFTFNKETNFYFLLLILLSFYIPLYFTSNKNILKIPKIRNSKLFIMFLTISIISLTLIHYAITTRGHMVLSLTDVYDFREKYNDLTSEGLFGYINNWVSKVFIVLLLIWSLKYKKRLVMFFTVSATFLMFAFSGHKSVLAGIIVGFFAYYLFNKVKNRELFILLSFFILISGVVFLSQIFNMEILSSLIIRRVFFVPAKLNFIYYEFFSSSPHVFWSNSIFKYFLTYPYDTNLANVIGNYMGKENTNANAGFVASGFANAGFIGSLIYIFIITLLFNFLNHLSKTIDKTYVFAIMIFPTITVFISSDLFTALLTHGLLIAVLTLYLFSNKIFVLRFNNLKFKI